MTQQKYSQYIDAESGVVRRPEGTAWTDPFGDGVWRSAWFYASLIVIQAKDAQLYARLQTEHEVDISLAGTFLRYFREHCISDHGWRLPKNDSQQFSRDQLIPLLYLLEAVVAYAPQYTAIGKDILKSLSELEEHGRGLSDTAKGQIGRNIGYLIDVLSDEARYHFNYRTSDMTVWLIPAFGNINAAKGNRRAAYKQAFSLALKAHQLTGWVELSSLKASDAYSVFNALAAVSLQCIAWGKDDSDVKEWRANFKVHADDGWGPAFKIVAGRAVSETEIEQYRTAHVTREQDNDIIMAQRPRKIRDGVFDLSRAGGPGEWLVLDYVVLKALALLWQG